MHNLHLVSSIDNSSPFSIDFSYNYGSPFKYNHQLRQGSFLLQLHVFEFLFMFPVSFIKFMHYYVGYREFLMPNVTISAQIQTFSSFLHCTTIIHQEKSTFALIYYILISTNVMTLIGSVNLSHGTDACIHLQLMQYYEKMSK